MASSSRTLVAQVCVAAACLCLAGTFIPLGLVWLMGIASPTAAKVLILFFVLPGGLSLLLLKDGLQQRAYLADLVFCSVAEREERTVPRGEKGYKKRLDNDRDGLACEAIVGPGCYKGRCVPFG